MRDVTTWFLIVLWLLSACAPRSLAPRDSPTPRPGPAVASEYTVHFLEPAATRPVPIDRAGFEQAVRRLAREVRVKGSPREAARELLHLPRSASPDVETVAMQGLWLLEGSREHRYTLVPLRQTGPVALTPEAESTLRARYLRWCEPRGGGDCLSLLDDGPWLRMDDRRTWALALAFGSVLEETRQALVHELLDARALVSLVVWTVALYCLMWTLPEPTTKAVAATLTVLLVGWLGLDTVWGLMDGWVRLSQAAHEATTFEELRAAGEAYGKVLGEDAARAMVLAVTALTGRTLGEVAARVRTLPGHALAEAQWRAQGGAVVLGQAPALAAAVESVETMALSVQGPLALVLLKQGAGGAGAGGRGSATVLRHRGGNQQVELANGQRWHLPRGKSVADIPAEDAVGDQLQEAVTRAAREWGPDQLSANETRAIQRALEQGKYWLARLLEREARGRFVEQKVYNQFDTVYDWSRTKGVDVTNPSTGRKYEILSGTESNLARHGRRMAGEFFRMLTF